MKTGIKTTLALCAAAIMGLQIMSVKTGRTFAAAGYDLQATSSAASHGASAAADGDTATYWMPSATDDAPALLCDLGELRTVTGYQQYFQNKDVWFFAVKGSLDGEHWATLADYSSGAAGKTFADTVSGIYRYVKIEFYSAENGSPFTSAEFSVQNKPLSAGENVALGMKGYSGSWAGGYEHERAFDGDKGSYYCANDGSFPQWCGVDWEYDVLVNGIQIELQDYTTTDFEVTAKNEAGDRVTVVERAPRTGISFTFEVEGRYSNFEYKVYSSPGWANLAELTVNGFKDLASQKCADAASVSTEADGTVYSFDYLTYIHKVVGAEQVEISSDGSSWESVSAEGVEAVCRYVRVLGAGQVKLYGMTVAKDLARGLRGAVSDYSNESFNAEKCTTNPEHVDGRNQFWCAESAGGEHWLKLDLGNACYVEEVVQKFQDYKNGYRFKIEASLDGTAWTSLFDSYGAPVSGQEFSAKAGDFYRYVRLTVMTEGNDFANSNQLQVIGYGSPVKEGWWQRESGVVRYYPKEQKVSIAEMRKKLDEYRSNGFKVIEVHQPYEGQGDIWSGLGATDNYNADPVNGTLDDWAAFLDRAHELGMYVFMFGNVGYARCTAEFFQKACLDYANGVQSPERDWFLFSETNPDPAKWFWSDTANAYYYAYWEEGGQIPNYNFDTEAWQNEAERYVTYWADFGFDGVALDAPPAYYFGSQDPAAVTYEHITKPLLARNIMVLPEGTGDHNYIYSYHYKAVQNYNMGGWGGGAWSLGIDAVTDRNARSIDDLIKGGRDNVIALGGSSIATLCFEQKYENVADYKRIAEAALLTTSGHMAFLHAGTSAFVGQDIIEKTWSDELKDSVFGLFQLQNSYSAFNVSGARYRVPTNDDTVYYAYCRSDMKGGQRALVVFNYSGEEAEIEVDLRNAGVGGNFVDLLTGNMVAAEGNVLKLTVPSASFVILGRF
jgi:glycosidase